MPVMSSVDALRSRLEEFPFITITDTSGLGALVTRFRAERARRGGA
jgi:hypothetical protein